MLKGLPLFMALGAGLVAAQETHNDIVYEVRFDNTSAIETTPIKDAYETAAAEQATIRLREALTSSDNIATECLETNNGTTPADLYALKDCIIASNDNDPAVFFTLLSEDISTSNTFWSTVVSQSSEDKTNWIPARVYVRAYFGDTLSATQFAAWTSSPNADAANDRANPEHYYKATQITGIASQASQIFEGWGGSSSRFGVMRTNFTVPEYTTPDFGSSGAEGQYPNEWSISSEFSPLLQRIGPKVLASSDDEKEIEFGALHIAVRDVAADAEDNERGVAAVEVYAAVWYPPWDGEGVDEEDRDEFRDVYVPDEAHHMVVEVVNLTFRAQQDCQPLGTVSCVIPQE